LVKERSYWNLLDEYYDSYENYSIQPSNNENHNRKEKEIKNYGKQKYNETVERNGGRNQFSS
jgi:hypothetical protein